MNYICIDIYEIILFMKYNNVSIIIKSILHKCIYYYAYLFTYLYLYDNVSTVILVELNNCLKMKILYIRKKNSE